MWAPGKNHKYRPGIVTFEEDRIAIKSPSRAGAARTVPVRQMTITNERYLEQVEQALPGISQRLNGFIDKLANYGVTAEFGSKSMILRWYANDAKGWNLGTVTSSGEVWTGFMGRRASELGLLPLSKQYLAHLAAVVPGAVVKETPNPASWYVSLDGTAIQAGALLEDQAREEGWLQAMAAFQTAVMKEVAARSVSV